MDRRFLREIGGQLQEAPVNLAWFALQFCEIALEESAEL
jgi:hypothetical protein